MAAVGSSVGLGNFWRFPYTAGENGGGAFIVIYLLCVLLVGLPLLMAEYSMGRKSGMSAIEGVESIARAESKSGNWGIVGWVGSLTAFFILTFYMVISVWLIAFLMQAPTGKFAGMDAATSALNFNNTIGQGENALARKWEILGLLFLFLLANVYVVGQRRERWSRTRGHDFDAGLFHHAARGGRFRSDARRLRTDRGVPV